MGLGGQRKGWATEGAVPVGGALGRKGLPLCRLGSGPCSPHTPQSSVPLSGCQPGRGSGGPGPDGLRHFWKTLGAPPSSSLAVRLGPQPQRGRRIPQGPRFTAPGRSARPTPRHILCSSCPDARRQQGPPAPGLCPPSSAGPGPPAPGFSVRPGEGEPGPSHPPCSVGWAGEHRDGASPVPLACACRTRVSSERPAARPAGSSRPVRAAGLVRVGLLLARTIPRDPTPRQSHQSLGGRSRP